MSATAVSTNLKPLDELFRTEEITGVYPGEILPVELEARPRGGPSTSEDLQGAAVELLKWVQSRNLYENPITKQLFAIQITADETIDQVAFQERLRVGARVERYTEEELVQRAELLNINNTDANEALLDEDEFVEIDLDAFAALPIKPPTIKISFDVINSRGIEPPYKVIFMCEPPILSQKDPTDGLTDADSNEENVIEPVGRQSIELATFSQSYSHDYYPPCRRIDLNLKLKREEDRHKVSARLSWPGGAMPQGIKKFIQLTKTEKSLTGKSPNQEAVTFHIDTVVTEPTTHYIWGTYEL